MHHDGPVRSAIFGDVLKLEAFGQIKIPLHRAELPEPADGVFDLEINLRAVKSSFALDALVRNAVLVEYFGQRALGLRPVLFRAEIVLVRLAALDRQLELDFLETEGFKHLDHEVHAVADLSANLFGRAEQVRVVNREAAHAHQAVERARQFGAIDRAHLAVTLRQVAITALLRFVDADVERAVHRLQAKLRLFQLRRREHRVAVVLFVSAQLPQLTPRDVRRIDETVVPTDQLFVEIILHLLPYDTARL